MRILISNDDGIHAPGILELAKAALALGEVFVVAPDQQKSASSHGISLHRPLYVNDVDLGLPNTKALSVSGTPVDCVKWAMVMIGGEHPFDIMLSGINEGANLATDVLYSGTVAAAGEAALQGIPAVAFSIVGPPYPFADAAATAVQIASQVQAATLPPDTFLNVNFPAENISSAPWRVTELGARGYRNDFMQVMDAFGQVYYRHAGEELEESGGTDTDVKALRRREVSITPLRYRFTNEEVFDSLKGQIAKP